MASFWSFLLVLIISMAYHVTLSLATQLDINISTISDSPALLPIVPLSSPALSPDITPLFPTPGGKPLSPSQSSLPTIPSTPSPSNPDNFLSPEPPLTFPPSGSLPEASSSTSLTSSGYLILVMFLLVFCIIGPFGM